MRVEPGVVDALACLQEWLQGALAIVTGRTLADIDRFLAPLRLTVASEHGAHLRWHQNNGSAPISSPQPATTALLTDAFDRLRRALQPYPDLLLEPKTNGFALHYRHAPSLEPLCSQLMDDIARELPGTELLRGKCVVELKLAGSSKGKATRDLLQTPPFLGRMPIFVGDDVTDETAFLAAQHAGGIGVKVGPGASNALARCESPAQVRDWLLQQQRALMAPGPLHETGAQQP
ncbi:Trehalose-6-phosphate phosphatase [bioreactor metagenome]|uniref:Trehalose-6-phosphate phosphatase n=1 Tax=bioreactor metagenome TaxID=1076179 RepID=A0A645G135_9ZZZZ